MTTSWKLGDRIENRWEIHRILGGPGKSGMGVVYVVYDHEWHHTYAAKTFQDEVFARSPVIAERFTQEALTWVKLDVHQNVAEARFVRNIGGKPYLFLECVSGGDLSAWIGTPRLTEDLPQVLRFAFQFCDGMTHALSKGLTAHRDIKPPNCLITQDGTLKVTDFGLAKVFDDVNLVDTETRDLESLRIGLTRTGMAAGTCTHMAPEQFDDAKRVDVRADIYSFGVLLFQMVEGRLPFIGATRKDFERLHQNQNPPALRTEHSVLNSVVQICLSKDPSQRFSDFRRVREQLAGIYEGLTGRPAPSPVRGLELDSVRWNNKGASLTNLGRPEEALACFERALAIDARSVESWVSKGAALGELGRYEEEIACLDRAFDINPNAEQLWLNRGAALRELKRLEEAIACYNRALDLNPHYASAWSNKGVALNELGRDEDAIDCYDHALELNPRLDVAWHNKGNLHLGKGNYEDAIKCFRSALAINPRRQQSWERLGDALNALGHHEEVIACCDRILELDRCDVEAWSNKGNALNELGQPERAILCLERALELRPDFEQAWYNIGNSLHLSGKREEANTCYDHAIEVNPRNAKLWSNKGAVLNELGRNEEAVACYDHALELDQHDAKVWSNKGNALNGLGQSEEGLACYGRALALNPELADAWFNKGVCLLTLTRFREALESFAQAQRLGISQAAEAAAYCRRMLA